MCENERERQRERDRDRQRQTDRQTDRHTDRQTERRGKTDLTYVCVARAERPVSAAGGQ